MNRPEIVFFDLGDTIITSRDGAAFDPEAGFSAVLEQMTDGPGVTAAVLAEDYAALEASRRFRTPTGSVDVTMNFPFSGTLRLLLGARGISLNGTWEEASALYWRHRNQYELCDGIGPLLSGLRAAGVRTAMITNNLFSADTVARRLDVLLPGHGMEFIVSSADYGVSKPDPRLFAVALRRARVPAARAWHAGDRLDCDVEGAAAAGIFPVWYRQKESPVNTGDPIPPHLPVHHWNDLLNRVHGLT